MNRIVDLRNSFISHEIYDIYSACMYMPTWEKFYEQAMQLISDDLVSILGFVHNNDILGILVIRKGPQQNAVIEGIAVHRSYRQMGIGRQLIEFVFGMLQIRALLAETDDDAILFYKHCGFKTVEVVKYYDDKEYRRYKCVLEILQEV